MLIITETATRSLGLFFVGAISASEGSTRVLLTCGEGAILADADREFGGGGFRGTRIVSVGAGSSKLLNLM